MSCHDIGRGMNAVVRRTITLYDRKEIALEPAKKIIASCAKAVYWCDGNEYEAVDFISHCRCGKCLKLIPKGEKLYSIWDVTVPKQSSRDHWIFETKNKLELVTDGMCEECFDHYIPEVCDSDLDLEAMKRKIEEDGPDSVISEGKEREHNNGDIWGTDSYWYQR